ncbi:AbrB family transcriptional regulator [Frateuria aurantia]
MCRWLPWSRWCLLALISMGLIGTLASFQLPAAILLGAMAAAIGLATCDIDLKIAPLPLNASQAVIGTMIAHSMPAALWGAMAAQWPLLLGGVLSVVVASYGAGWCLMRLKVLPGASALWGSSPGAASAMMFIAEAYGDDIRLVAFMLYLRVVLVALVAALVAHFWMPAGVSAATHHGVFVGWLQPRPWPATLWTLAVTLVAGWIGLRLRWPAGALLLPLGIGLLLQNLGWLRIEQPPWLLATCYVVIGWSIGLRFTRQVLLHAARAIPGIMASSLALLLVCAGLARWLTLEADIDPVTAYLATSPGGADSIAIIAASDPHVDMAFVMAMQTARFLVVLLVGPSLARWLAGPRQPAA